MRVFGNHCRYTVLVGGKEMVVWKTFKYSLIFVDEEKYAASLN